MSQERSPDLRTQRIILDVPGTDAVSVRRNVPYRIDDARLGIDIYTPPDSDGPLPVIVFITGYPDPGFEQMVGCKLKEMGQYVSWARLLAASGIAAITYENVDPVADASAVLEFVGNHAADLGIDHDRIGIFSCSGNVPNALSLLFDRATALNCAVFYYGYMLDLEDSTAVAEASSNFGFANPCGGQSPAELPEDLPLLIVRAGRDEMPDLNDSIDRFVHHALAGNLPVRLINHADAPHAFDVADDRDATRAVIEATIGFLRRQLSA